MSYTLAILGGVLYAGSTIPYLIDIVRHRSKPRIVSWFNWSVLAVIATAAAYADHQYASAALTTGTALGTASVVVLGYKHGDRKFDRLDIFCQAGAIIGLLLWLIFDNPVMALVATVGIDFIAGLPTIWHAWIKPHEETILTYMIGATGSFCSLLAVGNWEFAGLLYPVYLSLANLTLVLEVRFSPHRHKE